MAQQKVQNVTQALERARQLGEVFLVSLSKEEIQKAGFDTSTFSDFQTVSIYLQNWNNEYVLKYIFDNDPSDVYYERAKDLGGNEYVLEAVINYLSVAQEDNDTRELEMPSIAVVSMVESHPLSPDDGSVFIYKVEVHTVKGGMRMEVFYICTLENQVTERVWGFGHTPKEALENAVIEYSRNGVSPEENPFQRIYDDVYAERDDQEEE